MHDINVIVGYNCYFTPNYLTIKFYCIIKQQIPDIKIKIKVILYKYTLHSFVHQEPKINVMTLL